MGFALLRRAPKIFSLGRKIYSFSPNQKARLWPEVKNALPSPQELQDREYLSVPEATIFLGVSQGRIKTLIKEGKLPAIVIQDRGKKRYRIPRTTLESYQPQPIGRPPLAK